MRLLPASVALCGGLAAASAGCTGGEGAPAAPSAEASPNASLLPAALASGVTSAAPRRPALPEKTAATSEASARALVVDGGAPRPAPLQEDDAIPRDTALPAREGAQVGLHARFAWIEPSSPPAPDAPLGALKVAHERVAFHVELELGSPGRLRLAFTGRAFSMPPGAELRARNDAFGHVLVWPDGAKYRVLPPGTLRALFQERRADVVPLVRRSAHALPGRSALGQAAERSELESTFGRVVLDQIHQVGLSGAGQLLCRLLVELAAIDPASDVCTDDLMPAHAEFHWSGGSRLDFDVTAIARRAEIASAQLATPPANARFVASALPPPAEAPLHTASELGLFRSRAKTDEPLLAGAPSEGLLAVNHGDLPRYVLLDGVPVARLEPGAEQTLIGLKPGRYALGWRDFLGEASDTSRVLQLPARVVYGETPDAGR